MVGLRNVDSVVAGDTTVFHINITNLEEVLIKAKENGGKVKREKTVIPAMGWYALITDPDLLLHLLRRVQRGSLDKSYHYPNHHNNSNYTHQQDCQTNVQAHG